MSQGSEPAPPSAGVGSDTAARAPRRVLGLHVPLLMIFTAVVLMGGFVLGLGRSQFEGGRDAMTARLQHDLAQLGDRLAAPLEKEQLRTQLQMAAADPPFAELAIVDQGLRVRLAARHRDDGVDAASLPGFNPEAARRALATGELVIDAIPALQRLGGYAPLFVHGDRPAGPDDAPELLYGSFDLTVEHSRLEAANRNLALRAGATVIVMSLLLVTALNNLILARLARVKDAMGAFARGDQSSRSDLVWNDEIGSVAEAFNAMAARLELEYQRILESHERYQQVVEGTTDLVYVIGVDRRFLFVNSASRHILGLAPEECVGHPSSEFVHPQDIEEVERWQADFLASTDDRASIRMRVVHRDGSTRHLLVNARKVRGPDGDVKHVDSIARDVTAVVTAESEKEKERHRFEALFEGARDGIVLCDSTTGIILDVNRATETLAEAPRASIIGRHYSNFVSEAAVALLRRGEPLIRTQMERLDGTSIPVEVSSGRVELPDGIEVDQVNLRDVRERQQFEDQLMHVEKMSVVGQLAGGVAHDFNNQLAGIIGFAELLALRLPEGELRNYVDRILVGAQRSADLTKQLLAFSRKGRHAQDPVDLHALMREAAGILERSIDPRIRVHLDLGAHQATVIGDPTQLQNALLNLGLNARDAMPNGGNLIFASRDAADEDWIELSVRDNGAGMDANTVAHAFEPFFTTKQVGEGTGMGLAAVYGTITGHGGTIDLSSHPGRGTICTILLPRLAVAGNTPGPAAVPARRDDSPRSFRVLLVDDEEAVRDAMAEILRSDGFQAETCDSGRSALQKIREQPRGWDLVLLDLRMPDLSGEDTMQRIHVLAPDQRVVLMSGYAPDDTIVRLRRAGALGLLRKPCTRAELLETVAGAIRDDA